MTDPASDEPKTEPKTLAVVLRLGGRPWHAGELAAVDATTWSLALAALLRDRADTVDNTVDSAGTGTEAGLPATLTQDPAMLVVLQVGDHSWSVGTLDTTGGVWQPRLAAMLRELATTIETGDT